MLEVYPDAAKTRQKLSLKSASAAPVSGIRLIEWCASESGNRRGFATVEILAAGLVIDQIHVSVDQNGRLQAALPAKPRLDQNRELVRDERGKPRYDDFLRWRNGPIARAFSAAVIAAIREAGHKLEAGESAP